MISDEFAFFGFTNDSWDRLVSLLLGKAGDPAARSKGVLVVVLAPGAEPVAAYHTSEGAIDPASLPPLDTLESFSQAMAVGACVVTRQRAARQATRFLAEPLDPEEDFVSRVMRFVRVLQELGTGDLLGVWPNPLPEVVLSAARPAGELLLPDEHAVVFGVFEAGELHTGAVLRKQDGLFDLLAGPTAISEWTGPLGGDWRRDHRVVIRAVEREVGPVHAGVFMDQPTAEALFLRREPGSWALAYAGRDLILHPFPPFAAAALGLNGVAGLATTFFQAIEDMDPDEVARIATGFWHGLTDGRGLAGLVGIPPRAESPQNRDSPGEARTSTEGEGDEE